MTNNALGNAYDLAGEQQSLQLPSYIISLLLLLTGVLAAILHPLSPLACLLLILSAAIPLVRITSWRPVNFIDYLILAWFVWLPLTLFWGLSVGLSLERMGALLCFPLAYIVYRKFAVFRHAEIILHYILWGLLAVMVSWGLSQGPETYTAKPQGPFNDPNTFAGFLLLLAMPLLARYLSTDIKKSYHGFGILHLGLMGSTALVFFLIASRGATIAALLTVPLVFFVARKQTDFIRKSLVILVAVSTAYFCADLIKGGDRDVFLRLAETVREGDSIRTLLIQSTIEMILDNPWWGSGIGSFQLLYARYRDPAENITGGGWAHNDYLQLWQEAGLPMLLILLALMVWLLREICHIIRKTTGTQCGDVEKDANAKAIIRMGYLTGVMVILLQAATNFMLYFSVISLVIGIYLSQASSASTICLPKAESSRAWAMIVYSYCFFLAYLLFGQVVGTELLRKNSYAARALSNFSPTTSRYEVAYHLSMLAPFHYTPPQTMALELVDFLNMLKDNPVQRAAMLSEVMERLEVSQKLAPCYLPFGTEALYSLTKHGHGKADIEMGERQVLKNLSCNPNHGLSYFYAGLLAEKRGGGELSLQIWQSGVQKAHFFGERVLLITAILSRKNNISASQLSWLLTRIESVLRFAESNPTARPERPFWPEILSQLKAADRDGFQAWGLNAK